MRIRFTIILTFILFSFLGKAQLRQTENWSGYSDYKVDTIVNGLRFIGEYKNNLKEGWWKVFDNNDLITKAYYINNKISQSESLKDGLYTKVYSDDTNDYTFRSNNRGQVFIRIEHYDSKNKKVNEEAWFSNYNELLNDTSFGLKKLDEKNFTDRNNKNYSITSSSIKVSDHDLVDEQITINNDGNYILKKRKYKLYNNRMMSFQNDRLIYYKNSGPIYTPASPGKPKEPLKSVRTDVFTFNEGFENAISYSVIIDDKTVLKGDVNSNGSPTGIWDFYHFIYYDIQGKKRNAAFSASRLFEFSKILQGDAPFINVFYFKDLPGLTVSDISEDVTQEYLDKIEKFFTSVDEPFLLTKFATFTKSGTDFKLEDNLGYHIFQKISYVNGQIIKGYLYTPEGKVYDSINLNKDEYGETLTKNTTFKTFPEHPMAPAYLKQLVDGIKIALTTATNYLEERNKAEWKNTKCKHCGKPVQYTNAVVVDGITCVNTTYPGGGIFCSNKCRYDYEAGYCRNK